MRIKNYIRQFFKTVAETPVPLPAQTELIDGRALVIQHYPLTHAQNVESGDLIKGQIIENRTIIAEVQEEIGAPMHIDTISVLRFNDALGFKNAVGAVFGERKKT